MASSARPIRDGGFPEAQEFREVIGQFLEQWREESEPTRIQASQSLRQLREKRADPEEIQLWRDALDWFFDPTEPESPGGTPAHESVCDGVSAASQANEG